MSNTDLTTLPDTAPTVIHTVEELEALDPDTLLIRYQHEWDTHAPLCAQDWKDDWRVCPDEIFPLAIVAPAEQVRAAINALEETMTNIARAAAADHTERN